MRLCWVYMSQRRVEHELLPRAAMQKRRAVFESRVMFTRAHREKKVLFQKSHESRLLRRSVTWYEEL